MTARSLRPRRYGSIAKQSGAATLVTVMVLFFVLAMMAAYANRNLVFEQRIAGNFFRSGAAAEAAESGVEWALAMLNGGNIDASCAATAAPGTSFRQRYLEVQADQSLRPAAVTPSYSRAKCVAGDGKAWDCQCPAAGAAADPVADDTKLQPTFGLRFLPVGVTPASPGIPGMLQLSVIGCSSLQRDCTNLTRIAENSAGKATLTVELALLSALRMPPASPLVAALDVDLGADVGLHNSDPGTNGLLLQTGGQVTGSTDRLNSLPGTPAGDAVIRQASNLDPAKLFRMYFGMSPTRYQGQPNVRVVPCAGNCQGAITSGIDAGSDVLWFNSDVDLNANEVIGKASAPAMVFVNGNLTVTGPLQFFGFIYVTGNVTWTNGSGMPSTLQGALVTAGRFTASGKVDIAYDAAMLNLLNKQRGAFVRIPGGWAPAAN